MRNSQQQWSLLPWVQVACGALHTLALIDDGTVAAFGDNEFGQTGLESSGTQVWGHASACSELWH